MDIEFDFKKNAKIAKLTDSFADFINNSEYYDDYVFLNQFLYKDRKFHVISTEGYHTSKPIDIFLNNLKNKIITNTQDWMFLFDNEANGLEIDYFDTFSCELEIDSTNVLISPLHPSVMKEFNVLDAIFSIIYGVQSSVSKANHLFSKDQFKHAPINYNSHIDLTDNIRNFYMHMTQQMDLLNIYNDGSLIEYYSGLYDQILGLTHYYNTQRLDDLIEANPEQNFLLYTTSDIAAVFNHNSIKPSEVLPEFKNGNNSILKILYDFYMKNPTYTLLDKAKLIAKKLDNQFMYAHVDGIIKKKFSVDEYLYDHGMGSS